VLFSLALALPAWPLLTAGAQAPGPETPLAMATAPIAAPTATLTRNGDDVIITGSVASLFNTGSFEGPNRAEKTNRARLTPDGVTVSASFDVARAALAKMRGKPDAVIAMPPAIPTVEMASLGAADSAALGAIDQVVPMAVQPMMPTGQLAYARETEPATGDSLSIDKYGQKVSQKDVWCMATAVYFEARGESYRGQVAVGQVVMNRLAHPIYPKDICAVVYQNQQMRNACQFSFACDGIPETITDQASWKQANEIAVGVINGSLYLPEVGKATHYHATYVYPDWAPRLKRVTKIGHHIFYQFKRTA